MTPEACSTWKSLHHGALASVFCLQLADSTTAHVKHRAGRSGPSDMPLHSARRCVCALCLRVAEVSRGGFPCTTMGCDARSNVVLRTFMAHASQTDFEVLPVASRCFWPPK